MSLVAARVTVDVRGAVLLRDLSLAAECARVLAVVGPSGAGKSTLLRVWAGEQRASAGHLTFDGSPIGQLHPTALARIRAVLPQATALRFPLTALEVATLGRLPHPGRGETRRDRDIAWAALELAEVAHLADRLAPTLSGGEQQRVQLARVLAQIWEPTPEHPRRYLLLDEPTANLDPGHAVRILARLRQFVRATDTALVLVVHDLGAASQCADDLALLHAGRCVAHGDPADVLTPERLHECFGARFDLVPAPAGRGFAVLPRPPDDLHP
ncbi:ATP-binding cassette domain-containing protein [Nannocystis punicea]|uniref:ATP-binding cassette domain-containing protein n=1 Tax=Nannocystis punicea TaxID=2995304 RepID=A0ABY7HJF1_9BACT|nr:ATP-binding cassette domain-containing protein [Nannocystis poenicansa]WAS99413.1 ATP-binding cassette domain-containing protein [Nannocystis poenicansa]